MENCPVCLVEHDEEIHAATMRVRRWFRHQVTIGFRVQRAAAPKKGRPAHQWQKQSIHQFPARQQP